MNFPATAMAPDFARKFHNGREIPFKDAEVSHRYFINWLDRWTLSAATSVFQSGMKGSKVNVQRFTLKCNNEILC